MVLIILKPQTARRWILMISCPSPLININLFPLPNPPRTFSFSSPRILEKKFVLIEPRFFSKTLRCFLKISAKESDKPFRVGDSKEFS